MNMREHLDLSAYLVLGPENTKGRPVEDVVRAAVRGGFTCIQLRSKTISARELIACAGRIAEALAAEGKSGTVPLLVNDRLDVALAARMTGVKVDGVHVGQSDIPPEACRRFLGDDAIVGLTAPRTIPLAEYLETADISGVDYFGAGPLHETDTKTDCRRDHAGNVITRSLEEFRVLRQASPIPLVAGGGVKTADLPGLAATGVEGFFVASAIAGAHDPEKAAREMVACWKQHAAKQ